jgi:hypothetical protein
MFHGMIDGFDPDTIAGRQQAALTAVDLSPAA